MYEQSEVSIIFGNLFTGKSKARSYDCLSLISASLGSFLFASEKLFSDTLSLPLLIV